MRLLRRSNTIAGAALGADMSRRCTQAHRSSYPWHADSVRRIGQEIPGRGDSLVEMRSVAFCFLSTLAASRAALLRCSPNEPCQSGAFASDADATCPADSAASVATGKRPDVPCPAQHQFCTHNLILTLLKDCDACL